MILGGPAPVVLLLLNRNQLFNIESHHSSLIRPIPFLVVLPNSLKAVSFSAVILQPHSQNFSSTMAQNVHLSNANYLHPIIAEFCDIPYEPILPSDLLRIEVPLSVSHLYGLLRAVSSTADRNPRTLRLSAAIIAHNSSNPTAWQLRRQSVIALCTSDKTIWERELAFCSDVILKNAKNYQAWEHRRYCASQYRSDHERQFVDIILAEDRKNYHAWSHRAWLVRNGLHRGELKATESHITLDIRNNSAWNHRWLVLETTKSLEERGDSEMRYALDIMKLANRNESVWSFIRALCTKGIRKDLALHAVRSILDEDENCIPARRLLASGLLEQSKEDMKKHCDYLAEHDLVRTDYWNRMSLK